MTVFFYIYVHILLQMGNKIMCLKWRHWFHQNDKVLKFPQFLFNLKNVRRYCLDVVGKVNLTVEKIPPIHSGVLAEQGAFKTTTTDVNGNDISLNNIYEPWNRFFFQLEMLRCIQSTRSLSNLIRYRVGDGDFFPHL